MKELFVIRRVVGGKASFFVMADLNGKPIFTPVTVHAHVFEKPIAQAYEFFFKRLYPELGEVKAVPLEDRRKAVGFGIVEMLVAIVVFGVLASMAVPNALSLVRYEIRHQAYEGVRRVRDIEAEYSICAAQNIPCPAITAQIPAAGTITTQGYVFQFAPGGTSTTTSQSSYNCYADRSGNGLAADGVSGPACALDGAGYPTNGCSWANTAGNYWTASCPTTITTTTTNVWSLTATPVTEPNWSFYTDGTGLIRYSDTASPATASSPLVP